MKKHLRRTFSLILSLVLVCTLAAFASAEDKYDYNEEETVNGNLVTMEAELTQYSVWGQIFVNDGELIDYLYAGVTYSYNVAILGQPPITDTVTSSGNTVRFARVSKEVTENISAMHSATYNYKARIPGDSDLYIGAPIILEY